MEIEQLIESVHPKTDKERNKLRKALSQVHIYDNDEEGYRIVSVQKYLMGVIHDGDWYCANTLRQSITVKTFEKSLKRLCSCVRDHYGRYWYYMYYYDTAYDDIHYVYIGANSEEDAYDLYLLLGSCPCDYTSLGGKNLKYPFFRMNVSDYMIYGTRDLSTSREQYLEQLLINNELL